MIETLPPSLRRAVSRYTGIVRSVEECLASTTEPLLFQASCDVGSDPGLLGSALGHVAGVGGIGRTRSEASSAAVGEALERYSATYVPRERLVVGTAGELGDSCVDPERFSLFSESQYLGGGFPYRRFDRAASVAWIEGWSLPAGTPALLPAELVYLGDPGLTDGRIAYSTSSGLACGGSVAETVLRGLFELLERDAFMIVWANRLSLPLLARPDRDAAMEAGLDAFDRTGLDYAAVDLSCVHEIPIVLGVVRGPASLSGALGVGAAAASTIDRACWKALSEAFATRSAGAKLELLGRTPELDGRRGGVSSFDDHIAYYAGHERARATGFLDASPLRSCRAAIPDLEGETLDERIGALCARVEAAGASAYAVDVTSPDVAALGLRVTRVVAPELCPLDASHAARFLGGRRLYEAAAPLGLRDGPLAEDDLNPDPHPFP
ncbi:MAG TPA: YcaO-like family protein [Gaiellaceae bacterium]